MQLSPDGRRLYATGFVGQGENARADGIWAIDTTTWRIVGRWLPGVPPIGFYLGDDGRRLYVQPLSWAPGAVPELRILDAATGAELDRVDLIPGRLVSLAQRYRETYGRSPDTRPGAAPRVLPMAAMAVAANPGTIVGGDAAAVELRFVAPGTDRPVGPGQPDVRYDPPARAWAALVQRHGTGDDDRTVGLAPAGHGVYRGTVALPSPTSWGDGSWSVRAVAEWPDGVRRRATLEDAVVVQRAFAGTDGRRYILEVATNPAPPVVDRPAAVRLAFVDAETRAPLPAGVSIAEDLPRDAEVAFFGAGVNSEDLRRAGHGVYEGEVQLWAPGPWRVWAALRRTGKPDQSHLVGSVRAVKGD
jgi:hypothetical protein